MRRVYVCLFLAAAIGVGCFLYQPGKENLPPAPLRLVPAKNVHQGVKAEVNLSVSGDGLIVSEAMVDEGTGTAAGAPHGQASRTQFERVHSSA
jgi:hypothetical protein